jgi:hypothetical protein
MGLMVVPSAGTARIARSALATPVAGKAAHRPVPPLRGEAEFLPRHALDATREASGHARDRDLVDGG